MNNLFRTMALRGAPVGGVDRELKTIRGVKVMQMGKVNDSRPWEVDLESLQQVVQFGNANPKGMKARFTHPSMSDDGFGKYLGRWTNFRIEGDSCYADLKLAESSFETPNGDLGSYVMDMAEEDPEAFGVSAATSLAGVMYTEVPEGKTLPLRIDGLRAVDFVDEPAATRGGLFDMASPTGLPALTSWIVDTHFADREPREVVERMCSFLSKHYGRDVMSDVLAGKAGQGEATPAPAPVAPAGQASPQLSIDGAKPFMDLFGDRGAKWYLEGKSLSDCLSVVNTEQAKTIQDLSAKVTDLETRLAAAIAATGENPGEAFSAGAPAGSVDPAKVKAREKLEEFKQQGASDPVAKFAAALAPKAN